mgnify:CR=1 FL=1
MLILLTGFSTIASVFKLIFLLIVFILIFGGASVAYVSSYLLGGVMEELKVKS